MFYKLLQSISLNTRRPITLLHAEHSNTLTVYSSDGPCQLAACRPNDLGAISESFVLYVGKIRVFGHTNLNMASLVNPTSRFILRVPLGGFAFTVFILSLEYDLVDE
jgi:hypothetical protein